MSVRRNKSLLLKFFVIFVLFLVIPLVAAVSIFNYYALRYSEEEISKSSTGKLKIIRSINDMLVEEIKKDSLRLSMNSTLNSLNTLDKNSVYNGNSEDVLKLSRMLEVISEILRTNSKLHSVYLYIENLDSILTTDSGVVHRSNMNDIVWLDSYREYKEDKSGRLWMKTRILKDQNLQEWRVITYIYPLTAYTTNIQGAFIINVREDALCALINNNNFVSEGQITIINNAGDVISSLDKSTVGKNVSELPYIADILHADAVEGSMLADMENGRQLVTYYKTNFYDWIYVGLFPMDILMSRVSALRYKVLYPLFFIVLAGLFVSYMVSRKLYSPVYRLVQAVRKRKELDLKDSGSELDVLLNAFDALSKNEDQILEYMEQNKRSIRDVYLLNLLNGESQSKGNPPAMEISFAHPFFICAVIAVDNYSHFCTLYTQEQRYYLKALIPNICEEVLKSAYMCAGVALERDQAAVIVNLNHPSVREEMDSLRENFEKIQKQIGNVLENTVTIALGRIHPNPEGIKTSFIEAQSTIRERMIYGHGCIFVSRDIDTAASLYFYPYTEEKHILNYVGMGSRCEMAAAVTSFIHRVRNEKDISIDNIMQIFNQLLGNTIKYLVDSGINVVDVLESDSNVYRQLLSCETLEEIERWFICLYERIVDYQEHFRNMRSSYIAVLMHYIHNHYHTDIDVNTLAEHVGLSYSYIRKLFRLETGKNITDYINSLRIDEAKNLLRNTDTSIANIAVSLGYNNDQSFSRFFRKYEGITPGDYRKRA